MGSSFPLGLVAYLSTLGWRGRRAITPAKAPHLFSALDEISAALGARTVSAVAFGANLEAGASRYGLTRKLRVEIGAPLFFALAPQERVFVLGHTIARGSSPRASDHWFIQTALRSLDSAIHFGASDGAVHRGWQRQLNVEGIATAAGRIPGALSQLFSAPIRWIVRTLARAWRSLLLGLVSGASDRAVFQADALSAWLAGATPTDRALHILQLHEELANARYRAAATASCVAEFARRVDALSDDELRALVADEDAPDPGEALPVPLLTDRLLTLAATSGCPAEPTLMIGSERWRACRRRTRNRSHGN